MYSGNNVFYFGDSDYVHPGNICVVPANTSYCDLTYACTNSVLLKRVNSAKLTCFKQETTRSDTTTYNAANVRASHVVFRECQ